jgi:hypothetical protein
MSVPGGDKSLSLEAVGGPSCGFGGVCEAAVFCAAVPGCGALLFLETRLAVGAGGFLGTVTTTGGRSAEVEPELGFLFPEGGCDSGVAFWPKAGANDTSDRTAATEIRVLIT